MASYFETFSLTSRSRRCREVSDAVVWTFSWHRGRWQLFGCCSGSRRGRCNSSVFDSWSAPCSRARPCARGQLSFVLNRHLSVSQQPLPSLRSRSQEAQMRFSCLDATTYLSWPRCLEKPHGVTHETDFITDGPFTLLCTPESGAVALFKKKQTRCETKIITRTTSLVHAMLWDFLRWTSIAVFDVAARFESNAVSWPSRLDTNVSKGDPRSVQLPWRRFRSRVGSRLPEAKRVRASRARRPLSEMWRAPRRTRPCFCSVWRAVVLFCVATAGWLARDMSNDQALRVV